MVFLRKSVLKICSKFTGEHLCRSVISIKLCSPVNLLQIFKTPFPRNTSGWLLLNLDQKGFLDHKDLKTRIQDFWVNMILIIGLYKLLINCGVNNKFFLSSDAWDTYSETKNLLFSMSPYLKKH